MRWLAVLAVVLTTSSPIQAGQAPGVDDWPQFRGRNVDGVAPARDVFPSDGEFGLEIAWKRPVGSGYSGLATAKGLTVTMFEVGQSNVMAAFDSETGEERWRFEIGPRHPGIDGSYNGPISTPLITENFVIGLGPWGRLVALDMLDGELAWSVHLGDDLGAPLPNYGFATSPILSHGLVILETGGAAGAFSAFSPRDGTLVWSAGEDQVAYQSAVPLALDGREYLLMSGKTHVAALDPATGEVLWRYAHGGRGLKGVDSLVPVVVGEDRLFLAHKGDSSVGVKLSMEGGTVRAEQIWESRTIRNSYTVAVSYGGLIYGFSSRFLACVDPDTGEALWRSRPPGDGFPIIVDGHLVILTKDGSLHVATATPEGYHERTSLKVLDEIAWTPPIFSGDSFYVRSMGELARVDVRRGAAGPPTTAVAAAAADAGRGFIRFLEDVAAAPDKAATIDGFLAAQESFPIIEGDRLVTFVYRGPGTDLAIAGDMIGSRYERPMTRVAGTNLFYFSTELEPDARVSYRFIRDYEEIVDPRNPRRTMTAAYARDMEPGRNENETEMSWMAMPGWVAPAHLEEPPADAPRGRLVAHELESQVYGDRHRVQVYLPAGYDQGETRYPVAYYHGGVGALRRGQLPTTLDNLLGRQVAPLIAVFIERAAEWIPDRYAEMWAEELVPFIDAQYRTIRESTARASIGGGDNAYQACYVVFKKPGVAGKLSSQSIGGLSFEDKTEGLKGLVRSSSDQPLEVYMDWGIYDLQSPQEAWDRRSQARDLRDFLVGRGYKVAGDQVHDGAGWPSWRNRTDVVLRTLFPPEFGF